MTIDVSCGRSPLSAWVLIAAAGLAASANADNRTVDGTGNNLGNPTWGAVGANLVRNAAPAYMDGFSAMPRMFMGPRDISNAVVAQPGSIVNSRNLSDMVWQWGQFLDHDFDLTPSGATESMPIPTPVGDPQFLGTPISFRRSVFDPATGVVNTRQQPNMITSYLDGSMIYGSSAVVASGLRTFTGGRLRSTPDAHGELLPYNTTGLPNDPGPMGGNPSDFFVAGDVRANEQAGLTAMHTLWMREHNRWTDNLAAANPGWTDEQVYQAARKLVGAEVQAITYNEWLPALVGPSALPGYAGYDPSVSATVSTEFSTAAFRFGHTMLSSSLQRLDNSGNVIPEGNLSLQNSFFSPQSVAQAGISPILRGLASQAAQEIDTHIIDDVRNFLFGPPGAGGMDLASLNIQRGRDHGLCDYNLMRQELGLGAVASFADISSDPAVQAALALAYPDVDSIDPWVGMLAEDHLPGSSVGLTMSTIILDQFLRARDGDRYFYLNDTDLEQYQDWLSSVTLGDILTLNTDITNLQGGVFFVPAPGAAVALLTMGIAGSCRRRRA